MPAKSKAQANLMRAALHGADFPAANAVRSSMSKASLKHYAETPTKSLPQHTESHAYNWRSRENLKRGRS